MGSTSKQPSNDSGNGKQFAEKSHYDALNAVYGKPDGSVRPLQRLIKTCPGCGRERIFPVFINPLKCENPDCGIELGQYVARWLPFRPDDESQNGSSNPANWRVADLRLLSCWDPPEVDVNVKTARELLREKLLSRVSPEDAHRLATKYLHGVRKISKIPRKTLIDLLNSVLESEGGTFEN